MILDLFLQVIYLYLLVVDLLHEEILVFLVLFNFAAQLRTDGLHFFTATAMFLPVELQFPILLGHLRAQLFDLIGVELVSIVVGLGGVEVGGTLVLCVLLPVHFLQLLLVPTAFVLQHLHFLLVYFERRDFLFGFDDEASFGYGLEEGIVLLVGFDEGVRGIGGIASWEVLLAGVFGQQRVTFLLSN